MMIIIFLDAFVNDRFGFLPTVEKHILSLFGQPIGLMLSLHNSKGYHFAADGAMVFMEAVNYLIDLFLVVFSVYLKAFWYFFKHYLTLFSLRGKLC